MAIAIRTNAGVILFSGDYKIDLTPIEGSPMDLGRLADLGEEGVLAYFGDSTNSERPGYVPSERIVGDTLNEVFERSKGRIIVASFASHIHRVSQVVEAAKKHDRLVGVTGRSMIRNVQIARELGYLDLPQEMMVDQRDVNKIPDSDIVLLTTARRASPRGPEQDRQRDPPHDRGGTRGYGRDSRSPYPLATSAASLGPSTT